MKTNKLAVCLAGVVSLGAAGALQGQQTPARDYNNPNNPRNSQSSETRHNKDYERKDYERRTTDATYPQTPSHFNKATKLIGMEVRNQSGEKLGDVKDIVIDLDSGKVSYVVLSSGGVLGVGDKVLAAPLTAFTRSPNEMALVLNATKENIAQAESIGNNWPNVQEPSFGAMPFWQKKDHDTTTPAITPSEQYRRNTNEQQRSTPEQPDQRPRR